MKSLNVHHLRNELFAIIAVLSLIGACSLVLVPRLVSAAAVSVTSITSTSTNVYVNTGFATTSRVTTGDTVNYQLTLGGTPLIAPQINIFSMGSTTMSGSGTSWRYSTTSATTWTEGPITFRISVGGTAGDATTTVTQASVSTNVTYDKTAPTLSSVTWSDADGSTQFSATDTLTLTFSETMATSTVTAGNADTTLALSGSHTFGTSPTVAWNTAGTVLTLTLGTSPTVATADTVDPTTAVKDSVGVADATGTALAITDDVAPGAPTGLADTNFSGNIPVTLSSTGSSDIHYTTDGTTPTCTTGTTYTGEFTLSETTTLKAVGCDEADNASSVTTAIYTRSGGNSGSGGGGGGGGGKKPTTPAISPSGGLSAPQIQAILDVLASFNADATVIANVKASLEGASVGSVTSVAVQAFKSDLTVGNLGSEVKLLQEFLNKRGYTIAESGEGSPGNETTYFGPLTQAALMKYQEAKGITPVAGYFGPKTRAAINAEK